MENKTVSTDTVLIPNHINELTSSLYKLQQEKRFCDVLIIGEDGSISAHSIILSAISSYFRQCIVNSGRKEDCISIYFNGELKDDLQNVITFIYTGCIKLTSGNIQRIIKILQFVNLNNAVDYLSKHVYPSLKNQNDVLYDSAKKYNSISKQSCFELDNCLVDHNNEQKNEANVDGVVSLTEPVLQVRGSDVNKSLNDSVMQDLGPSANTSNNNSFTKALGSGVKTNDIVQHVVNSEDINDICEFNLDPSSFQTVHSKNKNVMEGPSNIECLMHLHASNYDSTTSCENQNQNISERQSAVRFKQISNLNLDCNEIGKKPLNLSCDSPKIEGEINDGSFNGSVLKDYYEPKRGSKKYSGYGEKYKPSKTNCLKNQEHCNQQQRVLRSDTKNVTLKLTNEKKGDKRMNTTHRNRTGNRNGKMNNRSTIKIDFKNDKSGNDSRNQTLKNRQGKGVKSQKNKQLDKVKKKQSQIENEKKQNENKDNSEINKLVVKVETLDSERKVTSSEIGGVAKEKMGMTKENMGVAIENVGVAKEYLGAAKENLSLNLKKRTQNIKNTLGKEIGYSGVSKKVKISKNPKTRCFMCNLNFENAESYLAHKNEKHKTLHPGWNEEKKLYVCNYEGCDYQMRNRGFVARHKDLVHGEPIDESQFNIFRCEVEGCNYYHVQKSRIKAHLKDHSAEISVICDICGKGYKHKKGLLLHKKSHVPEEERTYKFACTICDKRFYLKGSLSQHMKRHTEKNTLLCHLCPYNNNCDSRKQLDIHLFKVHQIPLPDHRAVYRCSQCDYYTFYKNVFNSHLSKHAGEKFDCDVCGKSFGSKMNLKSHKRRHKVEKVKCPYDQCNYYGFKVDMRDHLLSMHKFKNIKPFACHLCEYRCNLQGNLTKHLRGKHKLEVQTTSTLWRKLMETGQGYDTIFDQGRTFAIERVERTPIISNEKDDLSFRHQQQESSCLGEVVPPAPVSIVTATNQIQWG